MQILSYRLDAYIPFEKDSIETFLCMCESAINNMTMDERVIFKLKSATHELLINSLEHGYNKNAGKVSFFMEKRNCSIVLEMSDEGTGLNPASIDYQKQNLDLGTLKSRGWGLLIIKKLSDDMKITNNSPSGTKVSVSICI